MGPRVSFRGRGKRPILAEESERRSKQRSEGSSQGPSSPPQEQPPVSLSCANRGVTTGRKVDFNFLDREGFTIGSLIKTQGWDYLCSLELPVYPTLVREFFSTVAKGSDRLVGSVRGVEVTLSERGLAQILKMPRVGPAPTAHAERASALNLILGRDDCSPLEEVYANSLSVEMRLLLSIVNRVLFPKSGRFDFISERDLVVMQSILEGIPLNMPKMMYHYINEAISKSRQSLPYGMVFTLLFEGCGVPIGENEPKKTLRYTDYYSTGSLHRMGFQKIEGVWVKKSGSQAGEAGSSRPISSPPHGDIPSLIPDILSSPSAPPPPSMHAPSFSSDQSFRLPDDQLRLLASLIATENREHLERVQSSFAESMDSLSQRISALEIGLPAQLEPLTEELRGISERLSVIEVSGLQDLSHEMGTLRGRIERAATQVEASVRDLSTAQGQQFVRVLGALERLIGGYGPGRGGRGAGF